MPSPPLSLRIDNFAMVAMQSLLNKESTEMGIIKEERDTGIHRDEILARMSYEIARAMEVEADKQV